MVVVGLEIREGKDALSEGEKVNDKIYSGNEMV
jgi:hypothetical protein